MSSPSPTPPFSPPPATPVPGSQAAEIAIVAACLTIFMLYHVYYFERHRILHSVFFKATGKQRGYSIDLWTTAIESRVIWAREMMRQPKDDDALLAMHTMRNVIIASTLMVTGIGQVLGRLFNIITQQSSMQQIERYTNTDPIGSVSFTSPELKVAVASAVLLISFGAFAQCARLSVHLSFMFRVAPYTEGRQLGLPLRQELVAMTHRVSVYFTVGIRLLFLFFILISWCMGVTSMLIFFTVVMTLMVWSDYMPTKLSSEQFERAETDAGGPSTNHSRNASIGQVSPEDLEEGGGSGEVNKGEERRGWSQECGNSKGPESRHHDVHVYSLQGGADGEIH